MNKIITAVFNGEVLRGHLALELKPDKGTRIIVSVILDNLVEELTLEEIVEEYPPLT
ncbi:MAG: DUF433 domain-containing protein [Trichodesmium sp.]